jgi:nucleoid-associated protein YgaU
MPDQYAMVPAGERTHAGHAKALSPSIQGPRQSGAELPREVFHEVVDGDTLNSIAARYLGDAALAPRILDANREKIPNSKILPIGLELQIPLHTRSAQPQLASAPRQPEAETHLVPIEPAPVMADANAR